MREDKRLSKNKIRQQAQCCDIVPVSCLSSVTLCTYKTTHFFALSLKDNIPTKLFAWLIVFIFQQYSCSHVNVYL